MFDSDGLDAALATLGALLEERGQQIGLLIIGGSSLLMLELIQRPTADVDVVGISHHDRYYRAHELPHFLAEAVRDVGDALGLAPTWLNAGPAGLIDFGLPPGLEERVEVRTYGALESTCQRARTSSVSSCTRRSTRQSRVATFRTCGRWLPRRSS